jgi:hypothetical protein
VQQLHGVNHHRVTLDDDTAYHMQAKIKKGELDRLRGKIETLERESDLNT